MSYYFIIGQSTSPLCQIISEQNCYTSGRHPSTGDLMATVATENIVKKYGSTQVLHGLDIDIADGEFTVLIGPSGCGKSTLLRMIAGLEDITAGEIVIGGKVVNDLAPKQRD